MKDNISFDEGFVSTIVWNMPNYNIIEHRNKGLYIVLDGKVSWQDPSNTYQVLSNEIIFIRQGSYTVKTEEKACTLLWIPLYDDFLRNFMGLFGTLLSEIKRDENNTASLIAFSHSSLLEESIKGLKTLLSYDCHSALIDLRIKELLLLLAHGQQGASLLSVFCQLSNRQAERLQSFMENNYLKEWKLNEFAKEFGMGLTTFKELFSTIYNTSPRAWISERRIMYAHQLLINTDLSIVDISMEAGFSSQSYFTQSYRKRFGFIPSRARGDHDE